MVAGLGVSPSGWRAEGAQRKRRARGGAGGADCRGDGRGCSPLRRRRREEERSKKGRADGGGPGASPSGWRAGGAEARAVRRARRMSAVVRVMFPVRSWVCAGIPAPVSSNTPHGSLRRSRACRADTPPMARTRSRFGKHSIDGGECAAERQAALCGSRGGPDRCQCRQPSGVYVSATGGGCARNVRRQANQGRRRGSYQYYPARRRPGEFRRLRNASCRWPAAVGCRDSTAGLGRPHDFRDPRGQGRSDREGRRVPQALDATKQGCPRLPHHHGFRLGSRLA